MRCRVLVELRPDILDPQGKAVLRALHVLGYDEVRDARIGKVVTLELDGRDRAQLEARVRELSAALLANPVIENFDVEWPA